MSALNQQHCFKQFKLLLTTQIDSLVSTTNYLLEIKTSIQNNDLEALQQLIKSNNIPLAKIERLENERLTLTQKCGFKADKSGFKECIIANDNQQKTLDSLQAELFNVMQELKKATEVNHLLVSQNKNRIDKSLSILTGISQTSNQTYSVSGIKEEGKHSRPLAVA
ncbi:MAG: flagellar protein FlgN [Gammaproteobacteria bacterium]|nr:flagellar protein FlgN [Gammaproteobacteria bacterium]